MGLGLPDIRKKEAVLFHQDSLDGNWFILQVPPEKKDQGSNTFRIDLENPEHRAWFQMIPLERRIVDKVRLYGHAAYFPLANGGQGEVVHLDDKELQDIPRALEARVLAEKEMKRATFGKWADLPGVFRRLRRRTPMR